MRVWLIFILQSTSLTVQEYSRINHNWKLNLIWTTSKNYSRTCDLDLESGRDFCIYCAVMSGLRNRFAEISFMIKRDRIESAKSALPLRMQYACTSLKPRDFQSIPDSNPASASGCGLKISAQKRQKCCDEISRFLFK